MTNLTHTFDTFSIEFPQLVQKFDRMAKGDGETTWDDGTLIQKSIGATAYGPNFLWTSDYVPDFHITGQSTRTREE